MRKKTFVLLISWLIIHLCYNGNSLQTSNLPFNTYISFSVGAFLEIPVNMFCILSLDRFGRKWPDVICLYIGGILGIISGCLSQNAEHEIFVMAMLVRITFAAGTNITFQYTAELFPTEVRGRGLSLQRMFGAIGSCLAPTVVFWTTFEYSVHRSSHSCFLVEKIAMKLLLLFSKKKYFTLIATLHQAEIDRLLPMMVLGCLSLVAGSLIIILPETTGHQLPHTLEEGEKFGAHESICSIFSSKHKSETEESAAKFGRDNLAADVPEGTQGIFIMTAKETEAKL
ncbi:organic cation transporter-like protein [Caerostris extrusa]|uniref:Organic cation transporter-like protein n=1 Tax=Caerostris extrusa TaxID=172846 RepID=A0AAV4RCZ8_CAEEX|nr:organic cation transporter-like protein [Caerostris extrusa]